MKRHLLFFGCIFLILILIGCQVKVEPSGVFPTPTLAFEIEKGADTEIEIVDFGDVIQATAVPFDYSKIEEEAEKIRQAEIAAIEKVEIQIDLSTELSNISPYIYGLALSDSRAVQSIRPTVYSWTGDGTVRYNVEKGRGWNEGREENYTNSNPYPESGNYAFDFVEFANSIEAATSFTIPSIGWVAKDTSSCSFPDNALGTCTIGLESTCLSRSVTANPSQTSEAIDPNDIAAFLQSVKDRGGKLDFISIMYEPELWGIIHYDVHPECMTYQEILDIYQAYSTAIRDVVPDSQLMGPGTCCWEFYFNSPSGPADKILHEDKDFIPWFLEKMQAYDEETGKRHLDILEIHYYPQDLANDFTDPVVSEHRLRSHRSLYDPLYSDESYISEPVQLIPRMNAWIDEFYPDTKLAISAWNFGAQDTMNGAITIAEVLGVFGQEELYYASFFPEIERDTPAFHSFKIYTNYDGIGGTYGDLAVKAVSSHPEAVSAYSSIATDTGNLHIILINRIEQVQEFEVEIEWSGFESTGVGSIYQYAGRDLEDFTNEDDPGIVGGPAQMGQTKQIIELPGYSITHMILEPAEGQDLNKE